MKKITTYNFEAFYLDYLEGNLSINEEDLLFNFLNQHPELKAELELYNDILDFKLSPNYQSALKVSDKEALKRNPNEMSLNNVDDFIISDMEHQLKPSQQKELKYFINQHQLQQKVSAYNATKLLPNLAEVYPNKEKLKHRTKVVPFWFKLSAAAALLALLFNVFNPNQPTYRLRQAKYQKEFTVPAINKKLITPKSNQKSKKTTQFITVNQSISTHKKTPKYQQTKDVIINTQTKGVSQNQIVVHKKNVVTIDTLNNAKKLHDSTLTLVPYQKGDVEEQQMTNLSKNKTTTNIKLVDMYPPVTKALNNLTGLDITAKKSTPNSDYDVTQIKIGKISFERKKKK